jgi:hypothetical protein
MQILQIDGPSVLWLQIWQSPAVVLRSLLQCVFVGLSADTPPANSHAHSSMLIHLSCWSSSHSACHRLQAHYSNGRVLVLKALCDMRLERDDLRLLIDDALAEDLSCKAADLPKGESRGASFLSTVRASALRREPIGKC